MPPLPPAVHHHPELSFHAQFRGGGSLSPCRHYHRPRNRAFGLDFVGGGVPLPATTHEIELSGSILGGGSPSSCRHYHHPRNRAFGLDFGGGGVPLSLPPPPPPRNQAFGLDSGWWESLFLPPLPPPTKSSFRARFRGWSSSPCRHYHGLQNRARKLGFVGGGFLPPSTTTTTLESSFCARFPSWWSPFPPPKSSVHARFRGWRITSCCLPHHHHRNRASVLEFGGGGIRLLLI